MLLFFLPGIIGVLIGAGYFTFFLYRVLTKIVHLQIKKWLIIVLGVAVLGVSIPAWNVFSLYAIIYFHLLVVTIILEILNIFLKKFKVFFLPFATGVYSIVLVTLIILYGFYNMNNVQETDYTYTSEKVDQLKILQITDLHMSNSVNVAKLTKYCDEMSKLKPDIVVLTGDIFDESTPLEDMKAACKLLGSLYNTKGIYYVYGNHDCQRVRGSARVFGKTDIQNEWERYGVTILDDTNVTIDNVTIIGRADISFAQNIQRKSTEELLNGVNKENYIIMLDHQPLDIEENAKAGVDLQLSGHTHGGQIFPMQQIQPLLNGELTYGDRTIDAFHAITSSGIAGWGYPIKTGAISEYVLITIE